MPPPPAPAGGDASPRERQIATDRPSPPSPGHPPGSSSPTTQHGGADGISDLSPRRKRGSVQVQPTVTRRPPPLPEELVEQVLLHFPPDDLARLVRATLVCWSWRRLICGSSFRRRFREFHGAPPMLGFFVNNLINTSFFVSTSATFPPVATNSKAVDGRHGRVLLLHSKPLSAHRRLRLENPFVVWDPIADQRRELPLLPLVPGSFSPCSWNATVLCAASLGGACDHHDCNHGPFLVVVVTSNNNKEMLSYVYSSETGAWSEPTSSQNSYCSINPVSSALVGNALYFLNWSGLVILKYDLGTRQMSLIYLPENYYFGRVVLMTMEDGGLGFATTVGSRLYLWSWEAGCEKDDGWAESGLIELMDLLPDGADPTSLHVIGCADSIGVVFLFSNVGTLTVDLKSSKVTRVWEVPVTDIFPYVSFYTPAFGAFTGEGPQVGISSA